MKRKTKKIIFICAICFAIIGLFIINSKENNNTSQKETINIVDKPRKFDIMLSNDSKDTKAKFTSFGSSSVDTFDYAIPTSDNGFLIAYKHSNQLHIIKLDKSKKIVFEKTLGDTMGSGYKTHALETDNYYVIVYSKKIFYYNKSNQEVKETTLPKNREIRQILKTNDNNFIVAINITDDSNLPTNKSIVKKFDINGKEIWSHDLNSWFKEIDFYTSTGNALVELSNGDILILTILATKEAPIAGELKFTKVSSNGEPIFLEKIPSYDKNNYYGDSPISMIKLPDNKIAVLSSKIEELNKNQNSIRVKIFDENATLIKETASLGRLMPYTIIPKYDELGYIVLSRENKNSNSTIITDYDNNFNAIQNYTFDGDGNTDNIKTGFIVGNELILFGDTNSTDLKTKNLGGDYDILMINYGK